jgi:DNA-binding YbaB/EbfC family protein
MKLPGGANMQQMMAQAKQAQAQLQEDLAAIRVEASTGGGMVTVKMDGTKQVLSVAIDPEAVEDVEMLQDMIRGAINECGKRVDEEAQAKTQGMLGSMGLPPGMF